MVPRETVLFSREFGVRATTAQLYPGRDTFEFDQRHVTKNQPITVLILLFHFVPYYKDEVAVFTSLGVQPTKVHSGSFWGV